ncbi:putative nucleotidyltransferase substrate binding domain-containing protein [Pseudohongiella sp.]|uniref:Cyclic nucleotide-binding domain-containing protein n=1 Tax=marine sediment metagenome TaxID=412755 RepID=A0A0F9WEN3_9ZZZZ|nr:putative nucleotidyltransferase substrate binding domain-containing protein [Pseudohongiella sp.]HDZ08297.1 cyclic nucleotide-binding/CBS domain-containing protein [Pseudohongiella sp.]HEA62573.1 cyclic nucleotide-binding/CBS domain-containing protein [Pseudohongiella sp.]
MEIEQIEILDFLKRHSPFRELPADLLEQVACSIDIGYFKAGSEILRFNEPLHAFHLIRSGAVETFRRNGELYNRLSEGGFFAEQGLLRGGKVRFPASALEDTLIYLIPDRMFLQLFDESEFFADYVEVGYRERRKSSKAREQASADLLGATVSTLLGRVPISIGSHASVRQAAQLMSEQNVSALLILHHGDETAPDGTLAGIITDKDMRARLIAPGLDSEIPVTDIMSADPATIDHQRYIFEAMALMLRYNLHHLPVLMRGKTVGIIAISDIIRYESQNSLYVVSSIFRQQTVAELQSVVPDVHACFLRMVNEDANSQMIGSAMAAIGRSFKQRLLELAEAELGPAPVPYCFLALGSMARDEQLIFTDQDNALILDNRFDPALHGSYFEKLASFVCDGLAACGYTYCTGKVMATNPQWRQPLRVWQQYFKTWMEQATAERLLHSSIFFDIDGVWGQTQWAEQLQAQVSKQARHQPLFLASMARNALQRTPPLGFFKDFVMEQDGKQNNSLNIKRRGTAPFSDLIRIYALAVGSDANNSLNRLKDIIDAGVLPKGRGEDLRDAFEVIALTRIRHQAEVLRQGREPDNNVLPEQLSEFERKHLKEAFQVLSNAQSFLKFHFKA